MAETQKVTLDFEIGAGEWCHPCPFSKGHCEVFRKVPPHVLNPERRQHEFKRHPLCLANWPPATPRGDTKR